MALARQGARAEAQLDLEAARGVIETKFRHRLDKGSPTQGFWFDWIFARILLREAGPVAGA